MGEPIVLSPALPASRRLPWDIHPALSEDRLRICARLLAHARRDAIRMASYEMGDTTWSVGCRAYAFGQQRMRRVAEKRTYNWLSVLDPQTFCHHTDDMPTCSHTGSLVCRAYPSRCSPFFRHQSSSISCPISCMVVPFSPTQPRICRLASGLT